MEGHTGAKQPYFSFTLLDNDACVWTSDNVFLPAQRANRSPLGHFGANRGHQLYCFLLFLLGNCSHRFPHWETASHGGESFQQWETVSHIGKCFDTNPAVFRPYISNYLHGFSRASKHVIHCQLHTQAEQLFMIPNIFRLMYQGLVDFSCSWQPAVFVFSTWVLRLRCRGWGWQPAIQVSRSQAFRLRYLGWGLQPEFLASEARVPGLA